MYSDGSSGNPGFTHITPGGYFNGLPGTFGLNDCAGWNVGNGLNGTHVYLDEDTGSLVIEAINLESDEQIEIEITTSGTIYEAEFGEIVSW